MLAVAEPDGSVGMLLSLPRNRQIEPASIRSLMCATLGGLETGAKGREQAQAAVLAHPKPVLISTTARDLAMQMEERVAAAKEEYTRVVPLQGRRHAALAKEPADNAIAPINARLTGQRYLVDGQVRVM